MKLVKLSKEQWLYLSELAHSAVFGKHLPDERVRLDYALLLVDEQAGDKPLGYVTCRELDSETVYWQFGGAFPEERGSIRAYQGYQAFIRWTKEAGYKRIYTYIENTNTPMLKMAMKVGYRIVGTRTVNGTVLVEHSLDFRED